MPHATETKMSLEERFRSHLPDAVSDLISADVFFGCVLGVGAGIWATNVKAIEGTESADLIALAGAAVGLLAVTLAVMALLMGFLSGRTERLIQDAGGIEGFFRPFKISARVSALAILFSVAGAIDASSFSKTSAGTTITPGPSWLAAALFGISIGFFVWAVVGVAQLVRLFLDWGKLHAEVNSGTKNS